MSGGGSIDLAKIFVGGLSWQTTEETLRYHFEQFGEVASVEVMRDRATGNPRGFAFVIFKHDETVDLIMSSGPHEVNHKIVDVKRAQARGQAPPSIHGAAAPVGGGAATAGGGEGATAGGASFNAAAGHQPSPEELHCKVFVGGLPIHLDNDGLKSFFSQFGEVTDAIVMQDQSQRSRGFGFVTFAVGSGGAQKAIENQPVNIDGKYVEVKLATPKGPADGSGAGGGGFRSRGGGPVLGLRAGAAAAASSSSGEFAGLAAAYGRNGWRAGYGTYAFGKSGWQVKDWEDSVPVEKSGFSFRMLEKSNTRGSQRVDERGRETKRPRY